MNKDAKRSLPPVIRVFLSSTFADMDKERSYFNEVLVPKINRICSDRGVSFFSVDLRWGITEEEQINGQVLPICLSEIDKCRPYFIGMVGNRYGSVLERVPDNISEMIPWLVGKEGHSITELEMLYAVLEHNDEATTANSAFYIRSDELTKQLYGDLKQESEASLESLAKLKRIIEEDNDTPSSHYSSIEEFGSFVMRDIINWLDINFPESEDIDAIRSEWYNSEILRNHIENTEFNSFLDSYIKESRKPLLIYGDGARGKTASLTAWTPSEGHKVLVNCGADDKYSYWPAIIDEAVKQISRIIEGTDDEDSKDKVSAIIEETEKHKNSVWSKKREMFFLTETVIEKFRIYFLKWFSEFDPAEKITVVINDLNLLGDEKSRFLSWLPSETAANIKLICSSNDDEMVGYSETLGWNNKEMPLLKEESAGRFVKDYLSTFGKSLSPSQFACITYSHAARFPGLLRFIIRFLINYGRFENLDRMITALSHCTETQQIYMFIYKYLIGDYTENEKKIARRVLALVRSSKISLKENECFDLTLKSCEITPIEWANICRAFEQLEIVHGDYWNVQNEETEKFIDALLTEEEMKTAHELLGDFVLNKLYENTTDNGSKLSPLVGAKYSKSVFDHYLAAGEYNKLKMTLCDRLILEFLYMPNWSAIRAAWMQLFLHTDIDVAEDISSIAREYCSKEKYYEQRIGKQLIGILIDFEFEDRADALCKELGIDNPGGTIDLYSPGVSKQFLDIYRKIKFLEAKKEYRALYDFIKAVQESGMEFTEMDICQLLLSKANTEIKLSYYSEGLESANEYFRLALKMGFFFEMKNALSMRAVAFNRLGRYDEALYISHRVMSIAKSEGELRNYLGELNLKAMISYKIQEYDESIAIFNDLYKYWSKLDNVIDLSIIVLNRCNAMSYKGDFKAALSSAEEWYAKIEGNEELISHSVTLLGNIGYYALECEEYDKAEDYLTRSIAMAKKHGFESILLVSYRMLITLYDKFDNVGKKLNIYNEKMTLHWSRGEYEELIDTLKKSIDDLLVLKHYREAKEIEKYWREKFSTLDGGNEYFERKIKAEMLDSISIETLEEQLIIARSEGDFDKVIKCFVDLANALGHSDVPKSVEHLLSAVDVCTSVGKLEEYHKCVALALKLVIENGEVKDEELLHSVYERTKDKYLVELVSLWIGSDQGADALDRLRKITGYYSHYAPIVVAALGDLKRYAVDNLGGEELIDLVNSIDDEQDEYEVSNYLGEAMLEDLQKNSSKLMDDYMSSEAEQLIAYFEKCIIFLNVFDKSNAASFAGNIALIFRRRADKEKTLYYHKLSMEIFSELEKSRDKLIEMTNLATAYGVFGELDMGINTLREALDYATKVGDHLQRALIADNLADFLRKRNVDSDKEEILRCFDIGESFFRSSGHTRDLVISIRNQLVYLYDKEPVEVWEGKLLELKDLVETNHFSEFDQSVRFFEWHAIKQKKQNRNITIEYARERVQTLIRSYSSGASIEEESEIDDYYKFWILPKDQTGGREELFVYFSKNNDNSIHVYNAFRPAIAENNIEALEEYISWWNSVGDYTLEWNSEGQYIRTHMNIIASGWDDICSAFERLLSLWMIDKTIVFAAFGGDTGMIKEFQGMKLKFYNS